MSSWDQANRGEKLSLVWRNRKKISQIIKDYLYLPFFLLIILYGCCKTAPEFNAGERGGGGRGAKVFLVCIAAAKQSLNLKVLSNGKGGGGEWYQSINFNKLSCRQVSFFGPKGTPSREGHKTPGSVLTIFIGALTNWCRKIRQNVSP
jgi:hypothetical protein